VFEELINNLKDFNIENDVMLSNLQKSHPSYSTLEKITWQIESFSNIEDRYVNYDWILKN
jgi:hypothetical protein